MQEIANKPIAMVERHHLFPLCLLSEQHVIESNLNQSASIQPMPFNRYAIIMSVLYRIVVLYPIQACQSLHIPASIILMIKKIAKFCTIIQKCEVKKKKMYFKSSFKTYCGDSGALWVMTDVTSLQLLIGEKQQNQKSLPRPSVTVQSWSRKEVLVTLNFEWQRAEFRLFNQFFVQLIF